ncbi:hypothetical protein BLNAU_17428 [Blattamonas nauphoetae]|uniref:Uncharacterized protein n=1 Tax=Blattamonas nauphoetae TaxID=2049346 RepID=A0ABQ9X7B2_9EUKA|nr:hypothetical protein BLNAU_17428 [Blattamonas nauphoetae]
MIATLSINRGTASGLKILRIKHNSTRRILAGSIGRHLLTLEVQDSSCMIGTLRVSEGCRRCALISLFDHDEQSPAPYTIPS